MHDRVLLQEDLFDLSIKECLQSQFYPRIRRISTSTDNMQYEVCMYADQPAAVLQVSHALIASLLARASRRMASRSQSITQLRGQFRGYNAITCIYRLNKPAPRLHRSTQRRLPSSIVWPIWWRTFRGRCRR
jgi:hypothetical protein